MLDSHNMGLECSRREGIPVGLGEALAARDFLKIVQSCCIASIVQLPPKFAVNEALVVFMQVKVPAQSLLTTEFQCWFQLQRR